MNVPILASLLISLAIAMPLVAEENPETLNKNAQLISAAKRNQVDLMGRLLNTGAAVNSRNRQGDKARRH